MSINSKAIKSNNQAGWQLHMAKHAAVYIVLGVLLLPGMDSIAKGLQGQASVATITFARNLVQTGFLLPLVIYHHRRSVLKVTDWRIQCIRSLCIMFCGITFFASVQLMPIADALAISFVSPMIVAALSPVILKEHLTRFQWVAVALGFLGAIIIIRPGIQTISPVATLPLSAAFFYAGYVIATRKVATSDTPILLLQFWSGLLTSIMMVPLMLLGAAVPIAALTFNMPSKAVLIALLAMGAFGTCGHFMMTIGARHVPATLVAGLGYAEIISAATLGWYFFHNFPDVQTWIGVAVIVTSGLWLSRLSSVKPETPIF